MTAVGDAPSFDLTGRTALITGGGRGLGAAIARGFAAAGADLVLASRNVDACQAIARELAAGYGHRAAGMQVHVGRWAEVDDLADRAYAEFGAIDILVNNSGMSPLYESIAGISEELFDKVIAVNLKGAFRLCALVGPRMVEAGRGSIINVSSTAAIYPRPSVVPYAAAKAGLNAITIAFAREFGPQVRCNAIMPGPFFTDVSESWDREAFDRRAAGFALRRGGEAREIVGAALYLASDASSFTTAAVITVDGGQ